MKKISFVVLMAFVFVSCKKNNSLTSANAGAFVLVKLSINDSDYVKPGLYNVTDSPMIQISFSTAINKATVTGSVTILSSSGTQISSNFSYANDSTLLIQPSVALKPLTQYMVKVTSALTSVADSALKNPGSLYFSTAIDTTDKFPQISDSALLTLVEQQTFNYFWSLGDPTSGMAKERLSQSQVTTGGSGFGVMSMLVGVQRNFITRAQALTRITTIVNFLTNNATRFHGAFSHWMNGTTGQTIPFGTEDDGADIVETSYMMEGLLCARQYFNSTSDANEISLRAAINNLWTGIDYNWFRQNGQNVMYWNWSPDYGWAINAQIQGWCEAMIAYVLGASMPTDSNSIPASVYVNGWAQNGGERNGNSYYGIQLPLGPSLGGPLFFAHYSFLGINPMGLSDAYANYWTQDTAQSKIDYLYCVANPGKFNGYGPNCWGLTASDEYAGYSAHSPTNDDGVISPTAAISSIPYTPTQSMNALRFFYYKLGDKIWGQYGFVDAFNLTNIWFDTDFLAIDQGPQIVMIENYRSGLLWNLFMSCPEVQTGLTKLGFQYP